MTKESGRRFRRGRVSNRIPARLKARVKAEVDRAHKEAQVARVRGLVWTVQSGRVTIDATVLAYLGRRAAEQWIDRCSRSASRVHGLSERSTQALKGALWEFWEGA